MSTLNYKLIKEDNYDNLSKRFGATLLANAGIFGDEDLTPGSTLSFTNLKDDEIKLIQDRTQQYLNQVNKNRELSYIKENRDYIDRENFWQGNNSQGKSDEELLSTYKGTIAAAKQEEKDRAVQAEKSRIATQRSQERAEHVARLKAQGVKNEETMRFSPEMRYHNGREQLINSTNNTSNPMLRGVTLNGNTGTTFEDSLQNKEDQHKLTEEIKDLTSKAATGTVGLAGGVALAPIIAPTAANVSKFVVKNAPNMIRDAVVYEKVIDPTTNWAADKMNLTGTKRSLFVNGIGFGLSGLGSAVMDRGVISGLQIARNGLDDLASRGGIMGKQLTDKAGRSMTKLADKIENVQDAFVNVSEPLRTVTGKDAAWHAASVFGKNAAAGTAYGAVEEHSPLAASVVAPLTSIGVSKLGHGVKRLAWLNSRGAQDASVIAKTLGDKVSPYSMIYDTSLNANRQSNGNFVLKRGLKTNGAADIMHSTSGEFPLMHQWGTVHKGNTYKSPYWNEVNPQRHMISKMTTPYEGTGWMARRSYGDRMGFYSPQSFDEFIDIAKSSYNKDGMSMYDYLDQNNLKYDLDRQGDLIIGINKNSQIKSKSKSKSEKAIGYNQKGNRQSSELFTTPEGTQVNLGSDFGGTGSGGAADAQKKGIIPFIVRRFKSSMDLGAYDVPVTGQIQKSKFTKKGLTTNNTEAYHKDGLPIIDIPLADKKRIHYKQGGIVGFNNIGL